jgi:hypothetical protein
MFMHAEMEKSQKDNHPIPTPSLCYSSNINRQGEAETPLVVVGPVEETTP